MKIKELFRVSGVSALLSGGGTYLTTTNGFIVNKSIFEDRVDLELEGKDGTSGQASVRVLDEYKALEKQLLNSVFVNEKIMGLNIDQLIEFETGKSIEAVDGRMSIK